MATQKHTAKVMQRVAVKPPWTRPPWGDKERVRLLLKLSDGGKISAYVGPKHPLAKLPKGATLKIDVAYDQPTTTRK